MNAHAEADVRFGIFVSEMTADERDLGLRMVWRNARS